MPDVQANIRLVTTGGDDSANEIDKATEAINRTSSSSASMQHQFQNRFQHIGLMLFAGDALRASGLGMETRQVINGLNTALVAGEASFGAAAGPAILFVTALTALAAIVVKVTEHHKSLVDSLDKTIESQEKAYMKTLENIGVIEKYNEVVGGAGGLLAHEKALAALQEGELLSSQKQQVAAIQALMQANITHAKVMSLLEDSYASFESVFAETFRHILEAIPGVGALVTAYELLKGKIQQATGALHLHGIQYQINSKEADALAKKNAALQVKLDQMTFSIQHQGKAWLETMKDADKNFKEVQEGLKKTEEATDKSMLKIAESVGKTVKYIGSEFGSAFAQVIVDGASMEEEITKAAKNMAIKFIESTVEMIVYWTALRAIMDIYGQHAAFDAAAHVAYPAISNMILGQAEGSFAGGKALGGDMVADRPTLVMFGEAGPERASFSPLGGGSSSTGSGGDTYNISLTMNANGITDPDTLAKQMGNKLVQMIRGQGQLNFVRA